MRSVCTPRFYSLDDTAVKALGDSNPTAAIDSAARARHPHRSTDASSFGTEQLRRPRFRDPCCCSVCDLVCDFPSYCLGREGYIRSVDDPAAFGYCAGCTTVGSTADAAAMLGLCSLQKRRSGIGLAQPIGDISKAVPL